MLDWFLALDAVEQLFFAAGLGFATGVVFTLFGEVVTTEDIV